MIRICVVMERSWCLKHANIISYLPKHVTDNLVRFAFEVGSLKRVRQTKQIGDLI